MPTGSSCTLEFIRLGWQRSFSEFCLSELRSVKYSQMEPLLNLRNPGDKHRKCLILAICSQTFSGKYSFTVF